jgi:hypothetical protein
MATISRIRSSGVWLATRLGREERSSRPRSPSSRYLPAHLRAQRTLTPAASAAVFSVQPSRRPAPPPRIASSVSGLYNDGWSGADTSYSRVQVTRPGFMIVTVRHGAARTSRGTSRLRFRRPTRSRPFGTSSYIRDRRAESVLRRRLGRSSCASRRRSRRPGSACPTRVNSELTSPSATSRVAERRLRLSRREYASSSRTLRRRHQTSGLAPGRR